MARPRTHRPVPRDSSRRRPWVYLAVAAFIIVDIILIALALNSTRSDAPGATPGAIRTFTSISSSPTPTPTATSQQRVAVSAPPTRILAALNATTAWRAITGTCPETVASPELTTDSGAHWKVTDVTGPTKVTSLQSIIVGSKSLASMVGLSKVDCTPELVKTFVAGDNYASYPNELTGIWFVNPANRASVHSPTGDFAAPCTAVIALASRDTKAAAVLCADQTVYQTTDAAAHWTQPATIPGAVNLSSTESGYIASAVGQTGCAGVQVIALSAELRPGFTGCLPVDAAPTNLSGKVAMAETAGTLWVWAADVVKRSSDGGVSWQ